MPDFNNLKPLRFHRKVLSIVIIILLAFLIFAPKHFLSGENNFNNDNSKVIAKSGLKIRNNPSLNSEIIATIEFGENIKIIDKEVKNDIVNGENGKWYKIEYKNQIGYAWSKFISE
ncbi:SH3 domain-containing protein [Flavobacterium psychrophilum]|jgi:uncharacterized protein YgiM (DUF1202 family)|nr:SH3 domain-containing protein [Flavobacterium psychrophilum]